MKKRLALRIGLMVVASFLALPNIQAQQPAYSIPKEAKRILFLGNSITYAGHYVNYVVATLHLTYPDRDFEFINMGLPSETVSGLSEPDHADGRFPRPDLHSRLDRILEMVVPDLIVSCYGMNDGIYLPFDESRFGYYREGIQKLYAKAGDKSIPIIHLTPPVYDPLKGAEYAEVLDRYSEWLWHQRKVSGWRVIDIHGPMRDFLLKKREEDPAFFLAADGVHPGELGHWLMATEILVGLGQSGAASFSSPEAYFESFPKGKEVLEIVVEYQALVKDAWLTEVGHERPGMKEGLPLEEARINAYKLRNEIHDLIRD